VAFVEGGAGSGSPRGWTLDIPVHRAAVDPAFSGDWTVAEMTAAVLPLPAQAYVYVIGSEDGPQKIGIALDPQKRKDMLQTGNTNDLKCSFAIGVLKEYALQVEKTAHHILQDYKVRGEWFDVSPSRAVEAIHQAIETIVSQVRRSGQEEPSCVSPQRI
jgi:hypothetical protein